MSKEKKVLPVFRVHIPEDLTKKAYVTWTDAGKRHRKYGDINQEKTIAGRRKAAQRLLDEIKTGYIRRTSSTEVKVRAYLDRERFRWRKKTAQQMDSIANQLFDFLGGHEISQERLEAFLQAKKESLHATTYNRYVFTSKRLLSAAGYNFLFDGVERLRAEPTPARYFQRHQARRIMHYLDVNDPELALFVKFVYYCFIRPNELRRLKVGEINFDHATIRVPGSISKNKKTQTVVIPDQFLPDLDCLFDLSPDDYLFPSPRCPHKPYSVNAMYNRHHNALQQLRFGKGYSLYSWKHTGAVAAIKAGVGIKELQLQLRHSSLEETDRYLRQMGVNDLDNLRAVFPSAWT